MASGYITLLNSFKNTAGTLDGDVLAQIQGAPIGISYYPVSNKPTKHPASNEWDGYIIFKFSGNYATVFSVSTTGGMEYAHFRSLSTATSITWIQV